MIRMIGFDLDGTLLHDDKTISSYSKRVIGKCREKGIKIIFATVRGTTENIAPEKDFDGCVRKSGAVAYADDKLVYKRDVPIDDVRKLLLACDEANIDITVQNSKDGTHYSNFDVSKVWANITNYKLANFAEIAFDVDKICAITKTQDELEIIKKNFPESAYIFKSRDGIVFYFAQRGGKI